MNALLAVVMYALSASIHPIARAAAPYLISTQSVRAERSFSLSDRYPVPMVSDVFRDNILLTLSYMEAKVANKQHIDWSEITKPQSYSFTLEPGGVFAFHEDVLPQFKGKVTQTMHAHFMWDEGFKSDGWLTGDGVCHLASLLYRAAKDAGLDTLAPTNHNFADIPEVPKEYGVSIFAYQPQQNLYITNSFDKPVQFAFTYDGTNLTVKVID